MERLKQRDLGIVLEFLVGLYALRDLEGFPRFVISAIPKAVPSEHTSYNEVNPPRKRISLVVDPPNSVMPDAAPILSRHVREHPLIMRHHRTRDGRAYKISDFLSRRQFHRLALYNEYYRRVGVEDQIAFALPSRPPLTIGIALNRGRRNFAERDRLILNLLRPHLIQAYRNAEAVSRMEGERALLGQALEAGRSGVVVLRREGGARLMTAQARQWLAEYFGSRPRRTDLLPEVVQRWARLQEGLLDRTEDVPPPRKPLVVEREGKRLVVRLVSDSGKSLLLFEEQQTPLQPATLEPLGLTRRQAEVLAWVAEGKTNDEVGAILGTSPRTVQKHLERIYQKLGVETRTAAAARALQAVS